jgi:iron(III) transport system ATP-binding protein
MQLCDRIVIMEKDGHICQIGTDEEIIKEPANRFVFNFIGVSNFIPTVERDGKYFINVGQEILYSEQKPDGYVQYKETVMGIRPMDIIFDDSSQIRGTVIQEVFLGSLYNYFVRVGDMELRVQRSVLDALGGNTYSEGSNVGLRFVNEKYYDAGEAVAE